MFYSFLLIWFFNLYHPNNGMWMDGASLDLKEKVYNTYKVPPQEEWAVKNLESGDIICRRGNEFVGPFNFSDYICRISRSNYSHCGLIFKSLERVWVVDCDKFGVRRIPFSLFINETPDKQVKILRIKEKYEECIDLAEIYCLNRYWRRCKFDFDFVYGGDEYYCAELLCRSFASGHLVLAQPKRIVDFAGFYDDPLSNSLVIYGSRLFARKQFDFDMKIVSTEDIINSKYLTVIFEGKL